MIWILGKFAMPWSVKNYQRGVIFSGNPDSVISSLDKGSGGYYRGSYCAEETGTHSLRMTGKQRNKLYKFGSVLPNQLELGYAARCLDEKDSVTGNVYLEKNKCYSYEAEAWYSCMGISIKLEVRKPSSSNYEVIDTSNSIAVRDYDDCVDNYYGESCSLYTDAYCNGRGSINDGMSGDGYCKCNKDSEPYLSDLYCEKSSDTYFTQNASWKVFSQDFNKHFEDGGIMTSNPQQFPYYAYVGAKIEGKIFIPQNGDYDFRAVGTSSVRMIINERVIESNIESNYKCKNLSEKIGSPISFTSLKRGNYSFSLELKTGCQLYRHHIGLQWRRYPYYRNNKAEAPWEYVDTRFIGN